MTPELAAAIKQPAEWVPLVFTGQFINPTGWPAYIDDYFPDRTTSSIIDQNQAWEKAQRDVRSCIIEFNI